MKKCSCKLAPDLRERGARYFNILMLVKYCSNVLVAIEVKLNSASEDGSWHMSLAPVRRAPLATQ